jgi:phage/plasmid primase-like uncharacterized protein
LHLIDEGRAKGQHTVPNVVAGGKQRKSAEGREGSGAKFEGEIGAGGDGLLGRVGKGFGGPCFHVLES